MNSFQEKIKKKKINKNSKVSKKNRRRKKNTNSKYRIMNGRGGNYE